MKTLRVSSFDSLERFHDVIVLDERGELHLTIYNLLIAGGSHNTIVVRSLEELSQGSHPRNGCVLLGAPDLSGAAGIVARSIREQGGTARLVVAPCPTWFLPHLKAYKREFPSLVLVDNLKAGNTQEGNTILSWADYAETARRDDFVFIPTRDPILVHDFMRLAGHRRVLDLSRLERQQIHHRHDTISGFGYRNVFDATFLEASSSLVCGHTDMGRTARFAFKHLTPSCCAYDIGAHRGQLSAIFKMRCGTVHAFEPEPAPYADMVENLHLVPGIHMHNLAISDKSGTMDFFLDSRGEFGGGSSLYSNLNSSVTKIQVNVLSLEDAIRSTGAQPDLIKIDVEGAEPEVVFSGIDYVRQKNPVIIFEMYMPIVQARQKYFSDLIGFMSGIYDLHCLETGQDPLEYFMTERMPAMTNVAATPKKDRAV